MIVRLAQATNVFITLSLSINLLTNESLTGPSPLAPGTNMKQKHGYVSVSTSKVSLLAVGSFETQARSTALVHLHGTSPLP